MSRIKKLNKIQEEAIEKWINNNKVGTVCIHTGGGKMFVAARAILSMNKDSSVLFLAETTVREKSMIEEFKKFNKLFGTNLFLDYDIEFMCYQSACKLSDKHYDLVIADEVHEGATPVRIKFFQNNSYNAVIGLTATTNKKVEYEINERVITKEDYFNKYFPVIYNYTLQEGIEEGTSRRLNIYIIQHQLDTVDEKAVELSNYFTTEYKAYEYKNKNFFRAIYSNNQNFIHKASLERAKILYNLPSKTKSIKTLLNHLDSKTLIFGNSIEALSEISPVISSHNSEKVNVDILESFIKGDINVISSFKMLEQGITIPELDNIILHSYYSNIGKAVQRIGRLRPNKNKPGNVFIYQTMNTQEQKWFKKMISKFDALPNKINYITCANVQDCILKLKQ